ncbi:MAG TPA: hypothetical protein HA362_00435 [Nanoarchaeota archaeon]|nr:hypothetical protein [Nanoarchaeota archaeon]
MVKYEKVWARSIGHDLKGISERIFNVIDGKIDDILDSPNTKSKKIKGWAYNIRRIRLGNYRLLIYVDDLNLTVYCLAYLPRKNCYSPETRAMIMNIARNVEKQKSI